MAAKTECLDALRVLIDRADRAEIPAAQAAIIQFALCQPDLDARSRAMNELMQALAQEVRSDALAPVQQAFYVVVIAMIDRTRDAVTSRKPGKPDA